MCLDCNKIFTNEQDAHNCCQAPWRSVQIISANRFRDTQAQIKELQREVEILKLQLEAKEIGWDKAKIEEHKEIIRENIFAKLRHELEPPKRRLLITKRV